MPRNSLEGYPAVEKLQEHLDAISMFPDMDNVCVPIETGREIIKEFKLILNSYYDVTEALAAKHQ